MAEFGLFIGVREHKRDESIPRLRYPPTDATHLWSLFSRELKWGERARLVSESDQTATGIDDHLRRIGAQVQTGDVFVFFFAGHGFQTPPEKNGKGDQFLLLPNSDLGKLRRGITAGNDVLSLDSLMDTVANWRGQARCLFVLDCCRASLEALPGNREGARLHAEVEKVLAGLTTRDVLLQRRQRNQADAYAADDVAINVLNACSDKGQAYELEALNGSVFTTTWMKRIQQAVEAGKLYVVDTEEVEKGLAPAMLEVLPDGYRDRPQRPFLSRPDQPFVIYRPQQPPPPPPRPEDETKLHRVSAQVEMLARNALRGHSQDTELALKALTGLNDSARGALGEWVKAHEEAILEAKAMEELTEKLLSKISYLEEVLTNTRGEVRARVRQLAELEAFTKKIDVQLNDFKKDSPQVFQDSDNEPANRKLSKHDPELLSRLIVLTLLLIIIIACVLILFTNRIR